MKEDHVIFLGTGSRDFEVLVSYGVSGLARMFLGLNEEEDAVDSGQGQPRSARRRAIVIVRAFSQKKVVCLVKIDKGAPWED